MLMHPPGPSERFRGLKAVQKMLHLGWSKVKKPVAAPFSSTVYRNYQYYCRTTKYPTAFGNNSTKLEWRLVQMYLLLEFLLNDVFRMNGLRFRLRFPAGRPERESGLASYCT